MNKNTIRLIVVTLFISAFFFGSCSKEDSNGLSETENKLIGTWISDDNWYGQKPVMKLLSGGSLQYTNNFGETHNGTWSYNPNSNILTRTSSAWVNTKVDYVQSVSNTTLVLLDFDGDANSWHRQ